MDRAHGHELTRRIAKFGEKQKSSKSVEGTGVRIRESLREAIELSKNRNQERTERAAHAMEEPGCVCADSGDGIHERTGAKKSFTSRPTVIKTGDSGAT